MVKLFDLVKVNTATTGSGTITFGSVVSSEFFTPSEAGCLDGDSVRYAIFDGTDVEVGEGVIGGSVTTMTRTVSFSKISGVAGTSKISLSGTAYLALTATSKDILTPDDNLASVADAGTAMRNLGGIDASSPVAVTGTTTLTGAAFGAFHVISGTSANYTVTLPTPVGNAGKSLWLQVAGPSAASKLYTIATPAGTIDGEASRVMWAGESALLWSDGADWYKTHGRTIPFSGRLLRATDQSFTSGSSWSEVAFTSAADDPSGLNLCRDTTNNRFVAPRNSGWRLTAGVYIAQAGSPTFAQLMLTDATGNILTPSLNQTGTSTLNALALISAVGAGSQAFKALVRGDGTSPKVSGAAQAAQFSYSEIPKW